MCVSFDKYCTGHLFRMSMRLHIWMYMSIFPTQVWSDSKTKHLWSRPYSSLSHRQVSCQQRTWQIRFYSMRLKRPLYIPYLHIPVPHVVWVLGGHHDLRWVLSVARHVYGILGSVPLGKSPSPPASLHTDAQTSEIIEKLNILQIGQLEKFWLDMHAVCQLYPPSVDFFLLFIPFPHENMGAFEHKWKN